MNTNNNPNTNNNNTNTNTNININTNTNTKWWLLADRLELALGFTLKPKAVEAWCPFVFRAAGVGGQRAERSTSTV